MRGPILKWALIAVVLAVLLLFFLVSRSPRLGVTKAVRGPAVQAVYATGTVEPTTMMPLAPRVSARLMELGVDEGSEVKKDQLLARLEDEDLRQAFNQEAAREEFARSEFQRLETLLQEKAVSKQAFDRARSDWDAAMGALKAAQAKITYMTLLAPEDGRIIRRDGEIGQLIEANKPIFWFSCCAPLRISAEVDEEDIALVQPKQKVLIRAEAFPDQTYNGQVESITPKGDPITRSYRVRISFSETTPLQIGMTAETNIIVREEQNALLVPASAVVQGKVWVVKDGRLQQQGVTVGAVGLRQTEIRKGLLPEDLVVVSPQAEFLDGQSVRTTEITESN